MEYEHTDRFGDEVVIKEILRCPESNPFPAVRSLHPKLTDYLSSCVKEVTST
jgi:hypothetical protein